MKARNRSGGTPGWWSSPIYVALLLLLMAVPLLWPAFPPLDDVPTHMGRFRIQAGMADAPTLAAIFSIHWIPVGNLGADMLVWLIQPWFGIELATKIVVILIPVISAGGLLLIAKEAHGELPASAAFALPLIYGYAFHYGFINFSLAAGLAFLLFGLVLRYQRLKRPLVWRMLILLGSVVIYFAHIFGWVVFGLLVGGNALYRHVTGWRISLGMIRAVLLEGLLLGLPLIPIMAWRSGDNGGETSAYFDILHKWGWVESAMRDRWVQWDGMSALLCVGLIALGIVGIARMNRRLLVIFLVMVAFYIFIPYAFFGLIYADMRIAPLMLAIGIVALAPRRGWGRTATAFIGLLAFGFVAARTATTTVSYARYAQDHDRWLKALPHIPSGARVVALIAPPCPRGWNVPRIVHLPSMAIVRRGAFANDQFEMPGAQLVEVGPSIPRDFAYHSSEQVRLPGCDRPEPLLAERIARIPQGAFDHLWLLGVDPANRPKEKWLRPIWFDERSVLYAIVRQKPAAAAKARAQ
ncbi:hypothetical protein [Rhizorhabdus dicambivorans]|uniref:Glycosyltransferase RgtA/B/C/D-like domain-containing protein n=1 Tax=Rhizorhabdus dicambivorans TaxID=1850238 RepID=A0A2A4G2K5_9SPHN|nr:hypothetical protein [Rhizorhabdus dicambivorans]ATE64989.1 hypothetical protein CMV14_11730 [Rhizorhabdus dicambivorans]PCE44262.1 hypothetical protein COO09_01115 [Rhizorhabdus dicambivorans]